MKKIIVAVVSVILCMSVVSHAQDKHLLKIGSDAVVEEGTSVSNALVVGGDLKVEGTITGNALVVGGDLSVGPRGKVMGNTAVVLGNLSKEPGAEISKKVFELAPEATGKGKGLFLGYVLPIAGVCTVGLFGLAMIVGFLAIFLLIVILFTTKIGETSYYIERHMWKSFYYGLLIAILVAPLMLFLAVSVIGIPLMPVVLIIVSAATLFGYAAVCQLIGLKFFKAIKKSGRPMVLEVVIGFVILAVIAMIPFIGWAIKTLAWLVGLGATIATRFGTRAHH